MVTLSSGLLPVSSNPTTSVAGNASSSAVRSRSVSPRGSLAKPIGVGGKDESSEPRLAARSSSRTA